MKIEIQHSNGTIELAESPMTLQKGDTLIIDGNKADIGSFELSDNQLTMMINGEPFYINGIELFNQNSQDFDTVEEANAWGEEHTSIQFEDGTIIDDLASILDLMETAAGEEPIQSESYFPEFAERTGNETNVEATLRGGNPRQAEEDLQEIEIDRAADESGYNEQRKNDPISNNDYRKDLNNDGDVKDNTLGEVGTDEPLVFDNTDNSNNYETSENTDNDDSTSTSPDTEVIIEQEIDLGGDNVIVDTVEDGTQTVPEAQEEEIDNEDSTSDETEPEEQTNEPLPTNEEEEGNSEEEEPGNEDIIVPENDTEEDEESLDDEDEPDINVEVEDIVPENIAPEMETKVVLTIDEDSTIQVSKEDLLNNVTDANENDILDIGTVTSNVGDVNFEDGVYTISVPENYNGTIELSTTATDGQIEIPGKALITVTPVNDIPEANFIDATVLEDESVIVQYTTNDIDSEEVQVSIFNQPDNGTAVINDSGLLVYTPVQNFNGAQEITIKITDGENIIYETVNVTVSPVNDEPTIETVNSLAINEDDLGIITFNISDIDGDNTSFTVQEPENGTIIVDGTQITYIPDENYNGSDAITVNYTDGIANKSSTINIDVQEVNDAPYINTVNEVLMVEDEVQEILMDAGDIEGAVDIQVDSWNGVAIVDEDGNIIYSPNADFNGKDTIQITVTDSEGVETTKNINVQIDNDNTDIKFDISTETVYETHTEMVSHTETRDTETIQTRTVEVIDEEANAEAGITQNSDGEWTRTEEQTEVYNETITEEKTRDVQETFTNTRVETEEFQNTRTIDGEDTVATRFTTEIDTEAMTEQGYTLIDGEWTKSTQETFTNTRIEQETFQDTRDVQETFTNTRVETENFQDTRIVDNPDTMGTRDTEIVNVNAMEDAGYINNDGTWVKESTETFTNTRTESEEFTNTRDVEVQFQDTRTVEETFTNTKEVTEIVPVTPPESSGFGFGNMFSSFMNTLSSKVILNSGSKESFEMDGIGDVSLNVKITGNTSGEAEVTHLDGSVEIIDLINGTNNFNDVASIEFNSTGKSAIHLKDITHTVTHEEVTKTVEFEDTRTVEETFTNTRIETEEFQDTKDVKVEFQDTRIVQTPLANDQIIYETEEYIVDDNIVTETFTNTREIEVEFEDTRMVEENFENTRDITVEFEDIRTAITIVPAPAIIYETEEYIVDENISQETFTDTREITVEFEDTRTVQEDYTEDVDYERERLIDVEVEAEPITKEVQEEYTVKGTEEYEVQEEIQVQTEYEEVTLNLSDSEYEIDLSKLNYEGTADIINLDNNNLSGINLEDILDLSGDSEQIVFEGVEGSSIDFSEIPETSTITSNGAVEQDGETYESYTYSDSSLGQDLQMLLDNNIQTDF